jgi:hypothetical protein
VYKKFRVPNRERLVVAVWACHKPPWRVVHWMMIFTISAIYRTIAGFLLLPAHAQEPQKRTPALYGYGCPRSGRTRPSRPRHRPLMWPLRGRATSGTVGDRWIVNPASLWTASGPQSGLLAVHMLMVRPQALRAGSAPPVCHLFLLF